MADDDKGEDLEYHLNESQIADFRVAFNLFDKAGTGEIPTSQLGIVMKNLGHNLKPEQLEECIEAVDGDGSGSVDFDEFLALMAKKTKEAEDEQELREAFRVFDKNNRGVIDVADLKIIFNALDPDMPEDEIDQIIQEVDEDGSGTVDFEEFLKLMSG
jgi:calmodulin